MSKAQSLRSLYVQRDSIHQLLGYLTTPTPTTFDTIFIDNLLLPYLYTCNTYWCAGTFLTGCAQLESQLQSLKVCRIQASSHLPSHQTNRTSHTFLPSKTAIFKGMLTSNQKASPGCGKAHGLYGLWLCPLAWPWTKERFENITGWSKVLPWRIAESTGTTCCWRWDYVNFYRHMSLFAEFVRLTCLKFCWCGQLQAWVVDNTVRFLSVV